MTSFELELLRQELRGAKDAAAARKAQLSRLHAENSGLHEGGILRDELGRTTSLLREALESKHHLQLTMSAQARCSPCAMPARVLANPQPEPEPADPPCDY